MMVCLIYQLAAICRPFNSKFCASFLWYVKFKFAIAFCQSNFSHWLNSMRVLNLIGVVTFMCDTNLLKIVLTAFKTCQLFSFSSYANRWLHNITQHKYGTYIHSDPNTGYHVNVCNDMQIIFKALSGREGSAGLLSHPLVGINCIELYGNSMRYGGCTVFQGSYQKTAIAIHYVAGALFKKHNIHLASAINAYYSHRA